ncbi:tRNA (adenosine(37)-N6)-threonylcarbamoyltransferase complex transferase subunit TsaD [archaeon]|nr:tRNA (adenosine(37)-N6)-threonylcarbamoyltransferase complex transferase subunit TsaD [archaeon]
MKYIVGIESTAHTFGVGILDLDGNILANVRDSYTTDEGGMIPLDVRTHHARVSDEVFTKALKEAGVHEKDLEVVAFSNAPGLAPCLLEGMAFAKKLAKRLNVDLVEVNHCVAHLVIGESIGAKDPVMLYASGANTQIVAYEGGRFRIFGETLDLGVGNFIDTVARFMGLGFPGGPKIQELAEKYKGDLLDLPYSVKGMDVSFSGMQTKIRNLISKGENKERIAFALQETVFAMLVEVTERALAHTGKNELLIAGGVGCNSRLQEMCQKMCEDRGVKFFCPDRSLLVDNAAMIGYLGLKMFQSGMGTKDYDRVDIAPRERTDEVEVSW